jgi:hypothetical protein
LQLLRDFEELAHFEEFPPLYTLLFTVLIDFLEVAEEIDDTTVYLSY